MPNDDLLLIPAPRHVQRPGGVCSLAAGGTIHLGGARPGELLFTAQQLRQRLGAASGAPWSLRAGVEAAAVRLTVDEGLPGGAEAYTLTITPEGVAIVGGGAAGVFYGSQTLAQLLRQFGAALPCVRIEDAPDFAARGLMLDISRDKVPTMATLYRLIDWLAEWKINHLQLYTEHTFAYPGHEVVWRDASPITGEEALELDAYCRARFIELVPNQASFAHMEPWLRHAEYRHLAESPEGWVMGNVRRDYPFTLNPQHPGSFELVAGLYRDLLPHFSSRKFNVNLDEPFDLGQGVSKAAVAKEGLPAIYWGFVDKLAREVQQHGRQMLYWADFYWQHPESVNRHPDGAVALEWGYSNDHPFERNVARLVEKNIPFYTCPGTATWNAFLGRTENALVNITNAADVGLRHGGLGLLNTNWGDNGDHSYLPVSYLGMAYGAACGWCLSAARTLPLAHALSLHAFADPTGVTGQLVYDLGNAYRLFTTPTPNNVMPFHLLTRRTLTDDTAAFLKDVRADDMQQASAAITDLMARWAAAPIGGDDAALVRAEFANNAAMWQHGCKFGLALTEELAGGKPDWKALAAELQHIVTEHHRLWLARNRPGGLADSAARLGIRMTYYRNRLPPDSRLT